MINLLVVYLRTTITHDRLNNYCLKETVLFCWTAHIYSAVESNGVQITQIDGRNTEWWRYNKEDWRLPQAVSCNRDETRELIELTERFNDDYTAAFQEGQVIIKPRLPRLRQHSPVLLCDWLRCYTHRKIETFHNHFTCITNHTLDVKSGKLII